MKFEYGKYYRHTDGSKIHILAVASTRMWGTTLLAERRKDGSIVPIGMSKFHAANWHEITPAEFEEYSGPYPNVEAGGDELPRLVEEFKAHSELEAETPPLILTYHHLSVKNRVTLLVDELVNERGEYKALADHRLSIIKSLENKLEDIKDEQVGNVSKELKYQRDYWKKAADRRLNIIAKLRGESLTLITEVDKLRCLRDTLLDSIEQSENWKARFLSFADKVCDSPKDEILCNRCKKVLPPLEKGEGEPSEHGYLCGKCYSLIPQPYLGVLRYE